MRIFELVGIGMPGNSEMLVIFLVVLLLFGAKKLPELSRALGKSISEFKRGQKEGAEPDDKKPEPEKIEADKKGDA